MTDARNLVTVQRLIPAPAAAIFDLLADPSRHPQIDGSGTVIAPTSAGSRRLGLGDTFGMSMKLGVPYSTRNVVVEFEPDRLIAWQTLAAAPLDKVVTGRVWRYELVDQGSSTIVRETWDISRDRQRVALRRGNMPRSTKRNIERTLERIATVVEGS